MNYPLFYLKTKREDLAAAAFDLLYQMEFDEQGKYSAYMKSINIFMYEYRKHLLQGGNLTRIGKALKPVFTDVHDSCVWLIYQRLYFILNYLVDHELYEVLGNFWEINKKLAKSITKVRAGLDATPLESEENFNQFIEKMNWEIAKYIFENGMIWDETSYNGL